MVKSDSVIKDWFHRHPRLNPKSFTFDRFFRTITSPYREFPDFIIVGFQKCGTTTIFDNLVESKNIQMSKKKKYISLIYHFGEEIIGIKQIFLFKIKQMIIF